MRRRVLILICSVLLSVAVLLALHLAPPSLWRWSLPPASIGSDGLLWQVQTTFVSVGFAGLAIAAQLFADSPLAIGASRQTVLGFVRAGWFVGISLAGNFVIAVETIWLPSPGGVLFSAFAWALPSVGLLVHSTLKLVDLYGRPSLLDDVVRRALVAALAQRLQDLSRRHNEMRAQLQGLVDFDGSAVFGASGGSALRLPVREADRVVRAIKPRFVRLAMRSLAPRPLETAAEGSGKPEAFGPPGIFIEVAPGERARPGGVLFRVVSQAPVSPSVESDVIRLLQRSVEFEASDASSPHEETESEIAALKDAVGTSVRSGAFSTAERALRLLGDIVHELWTLPTGASEERPGDAEPWRDLLHRSLSDVERDVQESRRAADMFVSAAMSRALRAARAGVPEYVDDSLRSFIRLWRDVLDLDTPDFRTLPSRVVVCIENLAHYVSPTAHRASELRARATWTFVELVKTAIDSRRSSAARLAADELAKLFVHRAAAGDRELVRAGQLVLSGWVAYLESTGDPRSPTASRVATSVSPQGTRADLITARGLLKRGGNALSRWDWWEVGEAGTGSVKQLTLETHIDRVFVRELVVARGEIPEATLELSFDYGRYLTLLQSAEIVRAEEAAQLMEALESALSKWRANSDQRLAREPLSPSRVAELEKAVRGSLKDGNRLADALTRSPSVPEEIAESRPILGINLRVPRIFFVAEGFDQTLADPAHVGESIAQGFVDSEHRRLLDELRGLGPTATVATALDIQNAIASLGENAVHFVLVTPFGGLLDWSVWYSARFQEVLSRVTHIEMSMLDGEVVLFDARDTLRLFREPEEKAGLNPVEDTGVALGVFEDVEEGEEPQVRVEAGERFIVWAGEAPVVHRFRESVGGEVSEEWSGATDGSED